MLIVSWLKKIYFRRQNIFRTTLASDRGLNKIKGLQYMDFS